VYFWINEDRLGRPEGNRPRTKKYEVPFVDMGVFLLYFPTWLKFHELYRLGAYTHPNDFITAQYQNDVQTSADYAVLVHDWATKFAELISQQEPFAFLTPAMLEGSALGGPFLPTKWSLGAIHHYMGLGSIWTIGLSFMPSSTVVEGNSFCYRLFAFPKQWQGELPNRGYPAEWLGLTFNSSLTTSVPAERLGVLRPDILSRILGSADYKVSQIGAKLGTSSLLENPGWTSHFPGEHGLICVKHGMHQVSDFRFARNPIAAAMEHRQDRVLDQAAQQRKVMFLTTHPAPPPLFTSPIPLKEEQHEENLKWAEATVL
jgi:hypothetical protein